jgi:phenylalanyl-tRNA synthetase alpha chain
LINVLTNQNIEEIYQSALSELEKAETLEAVESLSVKYLGRKGLVTLYLRGLSALPPEERPHAGKRSNEVKIALEDSFAQAKTRCESQAEGADTGIDVTLPGRTVSAGRLHPLTQITQEICGIFRDWVSVSWKGRKSRVIITISRP